MPNFMTQIKQFCKWRALFLLSTLTGCFGHVQVSEPVQEQIHSQVKKQTLWLKTSLYAGPFYDDDRYQLLHPRRFEELTYLKTLDGDFILPPPATEIIPVGTRVEIEKIEWPTGATILKRPFLTPRHWAWLYVRIGRARGPVSLKRDQIYVLILPDSITSAQSFSEWENSIFSKEDPNEWLMSCDEKIRMGIFEKKPVIGMDDRALFAAMGNPDQIKRENYLDNREKGTKEIAFYGNTVVVLENSRVTKIEERKN